MTRRVNVLGVGMTKFQKPGASEDYHVMASSAIKSALKDANIDFTAVEQAYAGYVFGDSTCGQRAVYDVGLTGIPVFNVNNNCSTGSSALLLARQAVEGGLRRVRAGGRLREDGEGRARLPSANDRTNPIDRHANVMNEVQGFNAGARRRADVRRRRPRVPLEVRHQARDLRQDQREGAQARGQQPLRPVQPTRSASKRSWPAARSSIR